jgi:peptidoglycan/LPS O-acetylase OafA/YrhL
VLAFVLSHHLYPGWDYSATDSRFDSILWGCLLAVAWNPWLGDNAGILERWKKQLAVAGAVLIVGELAVQNDNFQATIGFTIQSVCLLPIFYLVLSTHTVLTTLLEWRWLREIGTLSYTLYLVHDVIRHALDTVIHKTIPVMLLSGIFSIAFALLMKYAVETPLRKAIR